MKKQDYTLKQLAKKMRVNKWRPYDWTSYLKVREKRIREKMVMLVPWRIAERLIAVWNQSCTVAAAAEYVGINPRGGMMHRLIQQGVFKTLQPFGPNGPRGQTRIWKSCLPAAKKYVAGNQRSATKARSKKLLSLYDTCGRLGLGLGEVYQMLVVRKQLRGKKVGGIWHVYEYSIDEFKVKRRERQRSR